MNSREIAIVGLGGVGGYFGFKLAQQYADTLVATIAFVARTSTYEVVQQNGLTLLSPEHPINIVRPDKLVKQVSELQHDGVNVLCVKVYDLGGYL